MKSLPWFRMWAEAVDDEKLRLLDFADRWHFVAFLCCKALGILDERDDDLRWRKLCVKMGLESADLEAVMKRLVTVGIVSCNGEKKFQPVAWNKRQFVSDSSTRRVRAFRERQRNVSGTASEYRVQSTEEENSVRASPSDPPPAIDDQKAAQSLTVDAAIFAEARQIFGSSIGGQLNRAIRAKGKPWVLDVIERCRGKDPEAARAYLAAAMQSREQKPGRFRTA
jgi:hypothetical protein